MILAVEQRKAAGSDLTVLTEAYAGVAETGSLVLLSGANSPTSLNFLPDNYLCILRREHLVKHIEDVWQRLRDEHTGLTAGDQFYYRAVPYRGCGTDHSTGRAWPTAFACYFTCKWITGCFLYFERLT